MISKYFVYFFFFVNCAVQFSAAEETDSDLVASPEEMTCKKWEPIEDDKFGQGRIEYNDEWNIGRVQCIPNTMTKCSSVEIRGKQNDNKVITIKKTDGMIATVYVGCKRPKNGISITEVSCHFDCEPLLNSDEDAGGAPNSLPRHKYNRKNLWDDKTN